MTRLSVNINKIATLRNARGGDVPNLLQMALQIERFGAQGITVHPRPDERHIRKQDCFDLAAAIQTELNIEGYPSKGYLELIAEIQPVQATLVPDPPEVLTSNAGWRVGENLEFLKQVIAQIKSQTASKTRVSLFVDPYDYLETTLDKIQETGADRIELYTERYAKSYETPNRDSVLEVYRQVALQVKELGLEVNAGHDLNLKNLGYFTQQIGCVSEVSIGHALIADALTFGLEKTVQFYLNCLNANRSP